MLAETTSFYREKDKRELCSARTMVRANFFTKWFALQATMTELLSGISMTVDYDHRHQGGCFLRAIPVED